MTRLCTPARRPPAGVDHQFDDIESESREMIRLVLGGHVFEAFAVFTCEKSLAEMQAHSSTS